jgi:hypothetical protein
LAYAALVSLYIVPCELVFSGQGRCEERWQTVFALLAPSPAALGSRRKGKGEGGNEAEG